MLGHLLAAGAPPMNAVDEHPFDDDVHGWFEAGDDSTVWCRGDRSEGHRPKQFVRAKCPCGCGDAHSGLPAASGFQQIYFTEATDALPLPEMKPFTPYRARFVQVRRVPDQPIPIA